MTDPAPPTRPTFRQALRVWLRVAALSFGGPAGQIAVMHRILVDELRWISESRFLHALNYCMLLPGPEAQQLATYIGWLLHGARGGLAAGLLFILPGFVSILGLSIVYARWGETAWVSGIFDGLQPAIVAVVVQAVVRIGRRSLKNSTMIAIAAAAFVAIFFFEVPFPLIILTAGIIGYFGGRWAPATFVVVKGHASASSADSAAESAHLFGDDQVDERPASPGRTLRVLALWLVIWWAPIAAIVSVTGRQSVYSREALFFSKTAVVTFGGAYAVLSYITQQCVQVEHWLTTDEMMIGLGMAETTPGPLIQVVQFVGFLAAYRNPEELTPLAAGMLGSVITTWATFAPCFLWIFVGAPYIERLRGRPRLTAALSTVTAAVVGVILNLSLWFALHTLFAQVGETRVGPLRILVPTWATLDVAAAALTTFAFVALFRLRWGMFRTLATCALAGLLMRLA